MDMLLTVVPDSSDVREKLTFQHKLFSGAVRVVRCYVTTGDSLLIPRMHFQQQHECVVDEPDVSGFISTLRDYQLGPATAIYSSVLCNGAALAHLFTGFGKTVLALWLVAALKPVCTIIYVHKKSLELQWMSQIDRFLSGPLACSVKVKTIQSQIRNLGQLKEFGSGCLLVFDEVHHMCARSFSQILFASVSQWHLGISATKTRSDGLEGVLHAFLGTPCIEILDLHIKPHIYCCRFSSDATLMDVPTHTISGKKVVNFNAALDRLCESESRNLHITRMLQRIDHRNVLVLTRRRSHASHLFDLSRGLDGRDVRILLGGMSSAQIKSAVRPGSAVILVATTQAAGEGFDMPTLDTILFATPSGNVTQETGRVLRRVGVNHPLVIDIIDSAGVYQSQFRKRHSYYKEQNMVFVQDVQ